LSKALIVKEMEAFQGARGPCALQRCSQRLDEGVESTLRRSLPHPDREM